MQKSLFSIILIGSLVLSPLVPASELLAAPKKHKKNIAAEAPKKHTISGILPLQKMPKTFWKASNAHAITLAAFATTSFLLVANAQRLARKNQQSLTQSNSQNTAGTLPIGSIVSSMFAGICTVDSLYAAYQLIKELAFANKDHLTSRRQHKIRIAKPFPGNQIYLTGLPELPGFYHMISDTPVPELNGYCGIHALYNMATINEQVLSWQPTDEAFFNAQKKVIPNPAERHTSIIKALLGWPKSGCTLTELKDIAAKLGISPLICLEVKNDKIILSDDSKSVLNTSKMQECDAVVNKLAQEWHDSTGPRVAHFLCGVPNHGFAISVVRMADGSQAMYLYDCLNEHAEYLDHMRQEIEYIYHRFF